MLVVSPRVPSQPTVRTTVWSIDVQGHVAQIRLDRADKRNALGADFWRDFGGAVDELSDSGEVRAAVLSGDGPAFCAGIDLSLFLQDVLNTESAPRRQQFDRVVRQLQDPFDALERARFPVVAAIHGACLGGGMALATACDLRVVSRDAVMRVEEINIGLMADIGTLQRLPSLLPLGVVHELAMLGIALDPERAVALGFATSLQDDAEATLAEATRLAERLADRSPLAVSSTKRSVLYSRDHGVAESLEHVAMLQSAVWSTPDVMAAIQARSSGEPGDYTDLAPIGTAFDG